MPANLLEYPIYYEAKLLCLSPSTSPRLFRRLVHYVQKSPVVNNKKKP